MQSPQDQLVAKARIVRSRLAEVQRRKVIHFEAFRQLKQASMILKACVNALNTISVTSIVLTFSGHPVALIVSAVANSVSSIIMAVLSVVGLDDKRYSHQTSYLQFSDLYDRYVGELLVDDLSSETIDQILRDLQTQLNLILDTCEPIYLEEPPENIDNIRFIVSHEQDGL